MTLRKKESKSDHSPETPFGMNDKSLSKIAFERVGI